MTSKTKKEAFVWIWLPDETEPVVAGRLEDDNGNILFNYGKSYLDRTGDSKPAIAIYEPELPLTAGVLPLPEGLTMPGCIRDAAPDAWGRRVIISKKLGLKGSSTDTAELDELTYLLASGSDRIGALDFQSSPTECVPRIATIGNTDDHARNHAAFWNGKALTLTPAYDICPQGRTGNEASQAMLISGDNNLSQLKTCLETVHNFLLSKEEAHEIFGNLTATIEQHWQN